MAVSIRLHLFSPCFIVVIPLSVLLCVVSCVPLGLFAVTEEARRITLKLSPQP